jgi:hypothetical protein
MLFVTHAVLRPDAVKEGDVSDQMKDNWKNVRYIVIDEVSTLGSALLGRVLKKLKQMRGNATGQTGGDDFSVKPWGGFHVIMLGDFCQLPPVQDEPVYKKPVKKNQSQETYTLQQDGHNAWMG